MRSSGLCVRIRKHNGMYAVELARQKRLRLVRVVAWFADERDADTLAAAIAKRIGKKNERQRLPAKHAKRCA